MLASPVAALILLSGCQSAESAAPPAPKLDAEAAIKAIDVNGDHLVTRAEWTAAGAPEALFNEADTNSDNALSRAELEKAPGALALDTDKDGKLTAKELLGDVGASADNAVDNTAG